VVTSTDPDVGATSAYSSAVVRLVYVTKGLRKIAGMGMLVGPKQVVTCAHVVNTALERGQTEQTAPADNLILTVEFPFVPDSPQRSGKVVAWSPPPQTATGTGDIAGIVLSEAAPPGSAPGCFGARASSQDSLKVFGYPGVPLRNQGRWVDVELKGEIGDLIQIESRVDQTIKAQPGYSGSPVWDHDTGLALGLLHAAPLADEPDRDALLFSPRHVATVWEEPFSYLLIPDNPYRGLSAFSSEDARLFFGRSRDIEQLAGLIENQPVAVVVGSSGVGKSSLVQAGLIPHLQQTPGWSALTMRPGTDPLARLADQLASVDRDASRSTGRADIERAIAQLRQSGLDSWAQFLRVKDRRMVILIDQFEELLAADEPPDPTFLELVFPPKPVVHNPIRFVVTLRADFLKSLLDIPGFGPRIQQGTYLLSPLTDDELRAAVEQPARVQGVSFEAGLVEQLIADATSDALPLLQFTLTQLWQTQHRKVLTFAGYHSIGRVTGALDRFAEQQIAALHRDIEQALDATLLHLIRTPPGAPGLTVRQRAFQTDLTAAEWRVARHLADARLATTGQIGDASYVELAHEALLTSWQRLQRLIREEGEFLGWLTWIEHRAGEGDDLSESRISEARRWLDVRPGSVPTRVREFIEHSESAAAARRAEQARADIAEEARLRAVEISLSLRLASEARQAMATEGDTALLVAWEAVMCDRNDLTEAVFREALENLRAAVQVLRAPGPFAVGEVATGWLDAATVLIADRTAEPLMIALTGENRPRLTVYDLRNGETRTEQIRDEKTPNIMVLPGAGAVTLSTSGLLRLLDTSGEPVETLALPESEEDPPMYGFEIGTQPSANGREFVVRDNYKYFVVSMSGANRLAVQRRFWLHWPGVCIRLEPSGGFVITQKSAETKIWRLRSGHDVLGDYTGLPPLLVRGRASDETVDGTDFSSWQRMNTLQKAFSTEPRYRLDTLAFDPDGTAFALTAGGTVDVWSDDGKRQAALPAEPGTAAIAYSAVGPSIAAAGTRIRFWHGTTARDPVVLHGHRQAVKALQFHPDDPSVLLSVDIGGEVRLWHVGKADGVVARHGGNPRLTTVGGWTICADANATTAFTPGHDAVPLGGALLALENSRDGRAFALVVDKQHRNLLCLLWEIDQQSPPRCYAKVRTTMYRTKHNVRYLLAPDGQHVLQVSPGVIATATVEFVTAENSRTEGGGSMMLESAQGVASDELHLPATGPVDISNDTSPKFQNTYVFRPDGSLFAAVSSDTVNILGFAAGSQAHFQTGHGEQNDLAETCIASDPRGEFLAVTRTWCNGIELWDWQGQHIRSIDTPAELSAELSVSPDGEKILVRDVNDSYWVFGREGDSLAVFSCDTFSQLDAADPSGRYVALLESDSLAILDWRGESLARLAGPFGTHIRDTAYSPSGDLVAVLFADGTIRAWNAPERRRVMSLQLPEVTAIAVSGDGRMILAASAAGTVTGYPLDVEDLFGIAAQRVSRPLLPEELERFGIDSPRLDAATLRKYLSSVG
jgi:WD40 repeat protein